MSEERNLTRSFKKIWEQTSVPARITIGGVSLLSIALMVAVGYWSMQPQYVSLAIKLDPQQSQDIVDQLESKGINYKRNFSGSEILVDQKKYSEAKPLIATIVPADKVAQSSDSGVLGSDPGSRETRRIRDLEIRLENTIERLNPVESASVHLGVPDPSPFAIERNEKTASVTIKVRAGTAFPRKASQSIILIVANGVDGLRSENISLQDTDGNSYSSDEIATGGVSSQLDYRMQNERVLAEKAESMLEKVLGPGRAVVRLTLDIDFTKVVSSQITYDPESLVKSKEDIKIITSSPGDALAGGASGSSSGSRNRGSSNEESKVNEFLVDRTDATKTINPGTIKRLSVAVLVQLVNSEDVAEGGAESASVAPAATMTKEQVESLVKNAVGFDLSRNDEIEVVVVDKLDNGLALEELIEPVAGIESMMPLLRNASLGIAAIVALILGFLTIKKMRPLEVVRSDDTAMTPQRARQLSDLAILARKNPDLVSSIMSAWINSDETSDTNSSGSTSARKAA